MAPIATCRTGSTAASFLSRLDRPSAVDCRAGCVPTRPPTNASLDRIIDDLLARESYGERWARHWLDVVRYADTNGYERDAIKPHAWRYRDYVIRAFNADKSYDRFILEQLAGMNCRIETQRLSSRQALPSRAVGR